MTSKNYATLNRYVMETIFFIQSMAILGQFVRQPDQEDTVFP